MTRPALPVVVARSAATQIEEVARWWAANALIAAQPMCGPPARNAALPGVRRVHLSRLNYFLYYRLARGRVHLSRLNYFLYYRLARGRVQVLAFWHARRGTGPPIG